MKAKKEKLTKANIIDAYKKLFDTMGYDNDSSGFDDTIDTFYLCSQYGFELDNSTIDKIELTQDGRVYFYYNQNTNDLDPIEHFSFRSLKKFYNALIDAWNERGNLLYGELWGRKRPLLISKIYYMETKIVGRASLVIKMAKHIKACSKELKDKHKTDTTFTFHWINDRTEIVINDICYATAGKLSVEELEAITRMALTETACNGVVSRKANNYKVTLFGKPVKPFRMLQRLILKYTHKDIAWNEFCTWYFNEDGTADYDRTTFLCYNEEVCQDGIDFIRAFRTPKDVLKLEFGNHDIMNASTLKLVVETLHGKKKAEIVLRG